MSIKVAMMLSGALVISTGLAGRASACTYPPLNLHVGETREQAVLRRTHEGQDQALSDAVSVFIADVVEVTRDVDMSRGGYRYEATIVPRAAIKGKLPERAIRYEFLRIMCGGADFPSVGFPMLFYADKEMSILGAIDVSRLQDAELKRRVIAEINRRSELLERPRRPVMSWHWISSAALVSLVLGYGLGQLRVSRKKTKSQ